MALATVVMFLAAAFLGLVITLEAIKRTLRAQATCVHVNARLNDELARALRELLRLNPRARRLRIARAGAEATLRTALLTGVPPAIAAAHASLRAVRALQAKLDLEQRAVRAGAEVIRARYRRELGVLVRGLDGRAARLGFGGDRALAVRADPAGAVAPEYHPARDFARVQAARVSFASNLVPAFAARWGFGRAEHTTSCVITLEKERTGWRPKIIAASAPSNSRSARSR